MRFRLLSTVLACCLCTTLYRCSSTDFRPRLEASYAGTIDIQVQNWAYNKGVLQQDTLYGEFSFQTEVELQLEDGAYTLNAEKGRYVWVGTDSIQFAMEEDGCLPNMDCLIMLVGTPFQWEAEGDSLRMDMYYAYEQLSPALALDHDSTQARHTLRLKRK